MTISEWKKDFVDYLNLLNIPRDDYKGIISYIDEIPTVEAEPIIRCKDCKHWKLLESSETIGTCWMFARYPSADSFCDKAERKGNETD